MEILSSIKTDKTPKRPQVGVVNPEIVSLTPITDTLEIKRKENPQAKIIHTTKEPLGAYFQKYTSLGAIVLGGIICLSKTIKRIFS